MLTSIIFQYKKWFLILTPISPSYTLHADNSKVKFTIEFDASPLIQAKLSIEQSNKGNLIFLVYFFYCLTQVLLKEDEKWVADYQHVIGV